MASRSWNRIELIGNLTRDPELRFTPNGVPVCTFGLATNRTYVVDGEKKEEVDFHRLVAWNKLAELCHQLLKKGTKAFLSGRMTYREWETQEGQKRRDAEIVVEDMLILTPKSGVGFGEEGVENVGGTGAEAEVKAKTEAEEPKTESKPKDKPNEDVAEDLPF